MATQSTTAVVAYAPANFGVPNFKHTTVNLLRSSPGPNEVLVRVLAAGICHSDIFIGGIPDSMMGTYPKVLGHEGAGYVEAVGSSVSSVSVGDPVLLSYTYCGECDLCLSVDDGPVYCQKFTEMNAICAETVFKADDEKEVGGKFFGQSSFASMSLVEEKSVVNVKGLVNGDEDLKLFSPLGCGLMTGSGAVVNAAKAKADDVIVVAGLGAVGLGAIMAGKISGCRAIIAVDRVKSRLDIAKQIGATHVFDTSGMDVTAAEFGKDFVTKVRALVGGEDAKIKFAFDTTGVLPLINAMVKTLTKRGKLFQIGVPTTIPTPEIPLDIQDLFGGTKRIEVHYLGECLARDHIPKMIQWYREGKFPFDKFVKFYPAKDVAQAVEDMKTEVIKPILVH
ncbi:hypothetical protein H2198_002158 [Neophaeococcomyces mojaviensis]|uniref:Uncharacterized protein n=1 Tax=Neophaeococcomyces mojaviensis TaxID=3383035 RepID=A0ACC3AFB9_9EURO|nr:hypothetical protein H2198_002158 [Knufia sp. JES_112]